MCFELHSFSVRPLCFLCLCGERSPQKPSPQRHREHRDRTEKIVELLRRLRDLRGSKSRFRLGHALYFVADLSLRYILVRHPAEGSHNGSAAVLKTAGRKAMQVRVLSPPPLLFKDLPQFIRPHSICTCSDLARSWRAFGAGAFWTKRQWFFVQRINCRA